MSDRKPNRPADDLLDWFTVSYRSIFLVVGVILVGGALAGYSYYARNAPPAPPPEPPAPGSVNTARFRSIEGSVKVKPVGTFEWVPADTGTVLRKSDLVRTSAGSAAEIAFFDGTIVHVRPDSLITIEETAEDPSTKQRKVAWHISSGEVNFQTVRRGAAGAAAEIS
ncbi:MAG TPA: FecR domain-containing protein, partial [Vicinamibacteria bacterium]|nr:FecR domain-containing protein [Vicinamibacteria bacterium]